MLEVTVKTLDSQNRTFSVPDDSTVKEFKQQIAPALGIEADKQRLIFCGRVLQDDKKLQEYNVDGKVIHLVQRPPPQTQAARPNAANNTSGGTASNSGAGVRTDRDGSSFLLGAFSIPRDVFDPNHVQNIVQDVVSGMGEWGRNATVMSRTSEDGSSVDVHINLGVTPLQSEAQSRLNQIEAMLTRASALIRMLDNVANRREGNSEGATPVQPPEVPDLEVESQLQNNRVPPTITTQTLDVPMFTQFYERSNNESLGTQQNANGSTTSEASSTNNATIPGTEQPNIGEGIAQAARAAVAAAVAAAAGAAAAAVRVTNTRSSEPSSAAPPADQNAGATEPTIEASESAKSSVSSSTEQDKVPPQSQSSDIPVSSAPSARPTSTNGANNTSSGTSTRQGPQRPVQPSVNAFLPLWEEISSVNSRLQPHIERCMENIRSEAVLSREAAREAQSLFDWISMILHYLAHAYHNLSDLYVNFNQPNPRTLRVRIFAASPSPTFVHTGTVPFQGQVNVTSSSSTSSQDDTPVQAPPRPMPTSVSFSTDPLSARTTTETSTTTRTAVTTSTTFGSGTSVPLMFNSSPSPFVFMEVSPGAITIDSISATLVDTHRSGVVTTAPSSSPTVLSSNISSQSVPDRSQPPPPPTSIPQTSTTSESRPDGPRIVGYGSLSPFMSSASGNIPPMRGFSPMNFPLSNFTNFNAFDPHLPCNWDSRHWAQDSLRRRRHNAGRSSQSSSSTTSAPTTTSSGGRQADILNNVISGLVNTVLTEATTVSGSRPITATASIPGFAVFAASASDDPAQPCNHTPRSDQGEQRTSANSGASPNDSQSTEAPPQNASSQTSESTPFSDDVFMSLIQGLQLSMSDQERITVAEFLTRLDESGYVEGQSILSDLFMCIAREATFQDMATVFFGQTAPLTRMKPALQQFVREKVLKNSEPTEENISRAAEEIIADSKSMVDFILVEGNIRNDIDYEASFNNFCRQNVKKLIQSVLSPPEDETFGAFIFRTYRQVLAEFIALNIFSFSDGSDSLERLTQMRINSLTHGMSPMIRQWIRNTIFQDFITNLNLLENPDEQISEYVVFKDVASSPDSPPETENTSNENSSFNAEIKNGVPSDSSPMSTGSLPDHQLVSDAEIVTPDVTMAEVSFSGNGTASLTSSLPSNGSNSATITGDNFPDVVIGSENWHSSVPRDWVPIITRDVHRQRKQASQAPFSDAYIDGMPSKRRKMMTNGTSPSSSFLGPVSNIISESLQQAIASTGAQPQTSLEQIKREVSQDASLQAAYKEQVKCAVQERLQNDMDYSPERFPNAEQYFNKGTQ